MLARMIEADDPPVDELENQDMERHSQGDKWHAPQPVLAPSGLHETRPLRWNFPTGFCAVRWPYVNVRGIESGRVRALRELFESGSNRNISLGERQR
jgi:hypothetical protein